MCSYGFLQVCSSCCPSIHSREPPKVRVLPGALSSHGRGAHASLQFVRQTLRSPLPSLPAPKLARGPWMPEEYDAPPPSQPVIHWQHHQAYCGWPGLCVRRLDPLAPRSAWPPKSSGRHSRLRGDNPRLRDSPWCNRARRRRESIVSRWKVPLRCCRSGIAFLGLGGGGKFAERPLPQSVVALMTSDFSPARRFAAKEICREGNRQRHGGQGEHFKNNRFVIKLSESRRVRPKCCDICAFN